MSVRSISNASKPVTLGACYFRMYQMVTEQERLINQKKRYGTDKKAFSIRLIILKKKFSSLNSN